MGFLIVPQISHLEKKDVCPGDTDVPGLCVSQSLTHATRLVKPMSSSVLRVIELSSSAKQSDNLICIPRQIEGVGKGVPDTLSNPVSIVQGE